MIFILIDHGLLIYFSLLIKVMANAILNMIMTILILHAYCSLKIMSINVGPAAILTMQFACLSHKYDY